MKSLTLLIIAFLNSILSQAQVTGTPTELEDALLWEISGNGLQKSSYLLGTMHTVGFRFMFDCIPGIRRVLNSVEQVATEIDMMALDSIRRKTPYSSDDCFLMPSDTTYSMLYNVKDFIYVDSVLSAGNARYAERTPVFWQNIYVSYHLSLRSSKQKRKEMTMDYFILQLAHNSSKKTFFLETIEEIINKSKKAHISSYEADLKEQASNLLFILKNTNMIYNVYDQMDSLYRSRKLSQLNYEDLMKKLVAVASNGQITELDTKANYSLNEHNSILVKERNNSWMLKIPVLINQGPTLIAVGAMHLAGDTGLINQLRNIGYTVKPVE